VRAAGPIRNGSRYGAPRIPPARPTCPVCGGPSPSTRAQYCSDACKQRAYRLRHADGHVADTAALTAALRRQRDLVAHTVYECSGCATRRLGERRCPDCNLFCRALGLGGLCPSCEEPLLVTDLLDL
jgi:hypothetical protein